jgi:hypothetical protein
MSILSKKTGLALPLVLMTVLAAGRAMAQSEDIFADGLGAITDKLLSGDMHGMARNLSDMFAPSVLLLFAIDTIFTIAVSAAIAFHPVRLANRTQVADLQLPKIYFLYGLVGMAIGFLVVQSGSAIGFVIFGIGGLLRFRSTLENTDETVEVILVTLLGLCVGLDLQAMALFITAAAWLVIWAFSPDGAFELNLKAQDPEVLETQIARLRQMFRDSGWVLVALNQRRSRSAAVILFRARKTHRQSDVENAISGLLGEAGVEWKLRR